MVNLDNGSTTNGLFALHGTGTGTGEWTSTMGNNGSWLISASRTSVIALYQDLLRSDPSSVPVPVQFPCSMKRPLSAMPDSDSPWDFYTFFSDSCSDAVHFHCNASGKEQELDSKSQGRIM